MSIGSGTRRETLDGIARILDASGLEDLFATPDGDALRLFDLLTDVARGRQSHHYWEICRTARRRGVTPEYVADRAVVLLASIDERRRTDLYRTFGVRPLANSEEIRQRWLDLAKVHHPDVGGDATRFRQLKEAWEILRDPDRRGEYERFWLRAHGPIERLLPRDDEGAGPVRTAAGRRVVMVMKRPGAAPAARPPEVTELPALADARAVLERLGAGALGGNLLGTVARAAAALASVEALELARLQDAVEARIAALERTGRELELLLALKRRVAS